MSALEVIEQIKALPPEEKPHKVHYVDQPTLEAIAEAIFDRYDDIFFKLAK